MNKLAEGMGQLEALTQLGLIPPESLAELGLLSNLTSDPDQAMGLTSSSGGGSSAISDYPLPATAMPEGPPQPGLGHFLRRIGPAAGGLVGASIAGMRHGPDPLAKRLLRGFLSGAGIGSVPNILASGVEALEPPR